MNVYYLRNFAALHTLKLVRSSLIQIMVVCTNKKYRIPLPTFKILKNFPPFSWIKWMKPFQAHKTNIIVIRVHYGPLIGFCFHIQMTFLITMTTKQKTKKESWLLIQLSGQWHNPQLNPVSKMGNSNFTSLKSYQSLLCIPKSFVIHVIIYFLAFQHSYHLFFSFHLVCLISPNWQLWCIQNPVSLYM